MKYTKKPVTIEAIEWTGKNLFEITEFIQSKKPNTSSRIASDRWQDYENMVKKDGLKIHTLEGDMNCDIGDFVIKGVKGEFYPCKPDIFKETYSDSNRQEDFTGLEMKYFVLKPKGVDSYAEASRKAIIAYAKHIQSINPTLANDLKKWMEQLINP